MDGSKKEKELLISISTRRLKLLLGKDLQKGNRFKVRVYSIDPTGNTIQVSPKTTPMIICKIRGATLYYGGSDESFRNLFTSNGIFPEINNISQARHHLQSKGFDNRIEIIIRISNSDRRIFLSKLEKVNKL